MKNIFILINEKLLDKNILYTLTAFYPNNIPPLKRGVT